MKPRLFLIAGPNDPNPDQEKLRQKLEPEAQKYLESFITAKDIPNSSRFVLRTLLTEWLRGRGRKVRLEVEVGEEVKNKEVTNVKELDELVGDGKTPSTLLQALGSASTT